LSERALPSSHDDCRLSVRGPPTMSSRSFAFGTTPMPIEVLIVKPTSGMGRNWLPTSAPSSTSPYESES
jgi:hypothetical protein